VCIAASRTAHFPFSKLPPPLNPCTHTSPNTIAYPPCSSSHPSTFTSLGSLERPACLVGTLAIAAPACSGLFMSVAPARVITSPAPFPSRVRTNQVCLRSACIIVKG